MFTWKLSGSFLVLWTFAITNNLIYSWTSLQQPPWGQKKVAVVERLKQEWKCGLSAKKNGCCREVAFSGGVMPKIVKTQNNTHTTIQKGTNNGFPNTKKPHTAELEFSGYRYYFSTVSHHNFISSTPAQIWLKHKDCTHKLSASNNILILCWWKHVFHDEKWPCHHWLRWSCFSSLCTVTSKKMVNIF